MEFEAAIAARRSDAKVRSVFLDAEAGKAVDAGEYSVSGKSGQTRIGISPRDEHPDPGAPVVVPFHGEAMGDILGCQTYRSREMSWSEPAQADETNPPDGPARDHLRTERRWEMSSQHIGVDPVVDEETSLNGALNGIGEHVMSLSARQG